MLSASSVTWLTIPVSCAIHHHHIKYPKNTLEHLKIIILMKLALRSVISIIAGISIIVISATVIAIVSTLYISAATDLALRYAKQLSTAGAEQVEEYLAEQFYSANAILGAIRSSDTDIAFPDENPSITAASYCTEVKTAITMSDGSLTDVGIIFDDSGSIFIASIFTIPSNGTKVIRCAMANPHSFDSTGASTVTTLTYDLQTGFQYNDTAIFETRLLPSKKDNRPSIWTTARTFGLRFPVSFFPPPLPLKVSVDDLPYMVFPLSTPMRNSSGTFVGALSVNINLQFVSDFLKGLDLTDKSHAFFIYSGQEIILASTHPDPIAVITNTTSSTADPPCTNSASANPLPINSIYCPIQPIDFSSFRPLQKLRQDNATIFTRPSSFDSLNLVVDGEEYIVSLTKLSNPGALFSVSITFFIYYNEIIDDIMTARNVTIGIGVGIFIVAIAISVGLIIVLLTPLEVVALQMNATSKLRLRLARKIGGEQHHHNSQDQQQASPLAAEDSNLDGDKKKKEQDDDDATLFSSILELFLLQKAYTNMHAAVDSFTRYIPKDLVKNLLATGQLTKNTASGTSVSRGLVSMSQKNNTMLMADVQGFTSISERVQIGDLSPVLSIFFEHMSSAIMQHEGIIVMYIGDAISATFGGDFACEYPQVKACLAALQMTRETCMPTLSDAFASIGETLNLRIGINSGVVLSGILGSRDRVAYSILGQASDLASSLEAWNKKFKTRVLISDVVAQEVERFFLLRCVYASPLSSSAGDEAAIRNRVEFAPGLSVVAPEDAKEFWKQNAEKIIKRNPVDNFAEEKAANSTTLDNNNNQLNMMSASHSRSNQYANGLLAVEDISSPAQQHTESGAFNPRNSDDSPHNSSRRSHNNDNTETGQTNRSENNQSSTALPSASASALLCYEVVGILPLDRIYFPAFENDPINNNAVASRRRGSKSGFDFSDSNNNDSFGTGSESDSQGMSLSGGNHMMSLMSGHSLSNNMTPRENHQNNLNINVMVADDSSTPTPIGAERTSSLEIITDSSNNNNTQQEQLRNTGSRRGSLMSNNSATTKQRRGSVTAVKPNQNSNQNSRRKKKLSDLFHQAAGTFFANNNNNTNTSDAMEQEMLTSSYPCSIVATPSEIDFCLKYNAAVLSPDSDAAIGDLVEQYACFFYVDDSHQQEGAGEDDYGAEGKRLQALKEIVGANRCPASLINAYRKSIRENL